MPDDVITDTTTPPTTTDAPATVAEDVVPPELGDAGKQALDRMKAERGAARTEAESLRLRLQAFEDRDKSDAQKLTERTEAAEKQSGTDRSDLMRLRVAMSKGLDVDLVDRLRGDTPEALAEDADRLLALLTPKKFQGSADSGARSDTSDGPTQLTQDDLTRMNPEQIVKAQKEGRCNDLLGIKR